MTALGVLLVCTLGYTVVMIVGAGICSIIEHVRGDRDE